MKNPSISVPHLPLALARAKDYWALSKPRVTLLVWATTLAGMVLAGRIGGWHVSGTLLFNTLVGSWLVIASANALNQVLEVDADSRMKRTQNRPIPGGRISVTEGLVVGVLWASLGLAQLYWFVNPLTAALGAASIALYVFAYTPLKPKSHLATALGAVPGAIPPLAGWTAVTGQIGVTGVLLFAIQFLWQFPHFWAIAWLAHRDYSTAGFKLLPAEKGPTKFTALQTIIYALLLIPLTILPYLVELTTGTTSIVVIMLANIFLVVQCIRLYINMDVKSARRVMFSSYIYLPVVLLAFLSAKNWVVQ